MARPGQGGAQGGDGQAHVIQMIFGVLAVVVARVTPDGGKVALSLVQPDGVGVTADGVGNFGGAQAVVWHISIIKQMKN